MSKKKSPETSIWWNPVPGTIGLWSKWISFVPTCRGCKGLKHWAVHWILQMGETGALSRCLILHIPACFVLNFGIKAPFYSGEDEEKKKPPHYVWEFQFRSCFFFFFFKGFLPKSFYLMDFTMSQMMLHTELPRLYLWTTAYLFKN